MTHPRSNNNSYSSREYSYKSQAANDLLMNEQKYFRNESDSFWKNDSNFSSPRTNARFHTISPDKSPNMNFSPASFLINESDSQWPSHNINAGLSSAMPTRIRSNSPSSMSDSHKINSLSLPHPIDDARDRFSIFGSYRKQTSERRTHSNKMEVTSSMGGHQSDYRNLAVKQPQQTPTINLSPNSQFPINSELQTSGYFTPNLKTQPGTLMDLLKFDETDTKPVARPEEKIIRANIENQNMASPTRRNEQPDNDSTVKENEINRLKRQIDKSSAKIKVLQNSNEELQNHVKNLLNERKQLIKQVENMEYEEIIEEEEVQRAKANKSPKDESNQQKSVTVKEEIVRENYVERNKVTLRDVPPELLNHFRKEIVDQEREKMELEKRTLIESLNIQYQQQVHSLKREQEATRKPVKHVSIQSYRNTKFSQTVSDVDFSRLNTPMRTIATSFQPPVSSKESQNEQKEANKKLASETYNSFKSHIKRYQLKTTSLQESIFKRIANSIETNNSTELSSIIGEIMFKPSRSIEVNAKPLMSTKQCQTNIVEEPRAKTVNETYKSFRNHIKKTETTTTKWQDSIIDRFANSLQSNDPESLARLIEEILFKPSRTIGINSAPTNFSKITQTHHHNFGNAIYEVNFLNDKPVVEKLSKSISASPAVLHKGSQPEELYYFETGTMTDHIFYRSQGVMTMGDFTRTTTSPHVEMDSFVTKSSNISKATKQIKSQSTILQSSTINMPHIPSNQVNSSVLEKKVEVQSHDKLQSTTPQDKIEELNLVMKRENFNDRHQVKDTNTVNENSKTTKSYKKQDFIDSSKFKPTKEIEITSSESHKKTAMSPKQIVEVSEQKIEETVQILTAHVDKDQKLKEETETIVECWETVSKLKDGKLVEKKESYRDKFVSSNPVEILKHLESHSQDHHPNEASPQNAALTFSVLSGRESNSEFSPRFSENSEYKTNIFNEPSKREINIPITPGKASISSSSIEISKKIEKSSNPNEVPEHVQSNKHHYVDIGKAIPSSTSQTFSVISAKESTGGSTQQYHESHQYKTNIGSSHGPIKEEITIPINSKLTDNVHKTPQAHSSSTISTSKTPSQYESVDSSPLERFKHHDLSGKESKGIMNQKREIREYKSSTVSESSKGFEQGESFDNSSDKPHDNSSSISISLNSGENASGQKIISGNSLGSRTHMESHAYKHDGAKNHSSDTFSVISGKESSGGSTHQHSDRYEYKTNIQTSNISVKRGINIPINSESVTGYANNASKMNFSSSTPMTTNVDESLSKPGSVSSNPLEILEHIKSHTHRQDSDRKLYPYSFSQISEYTAGSPHQYSESHDVTSRGLGKERINIPINSETWSDFKSTPLTSPSSSISVFPNVERKASEYKSYSSIPSENRETQIKSHTYKYGDDRKLIPENFTQESSMISGKETSSGSTRQYSESYEYKSNTSSGLSTRGIRNEIVNIPINTVPIEYSSEKPSINSSATIPIYKSTGEKISSNYENVSKIVTKLPVVTTRHESSSISELISSRINGNVTVSERTEVNSSSSTYNSSSNIGVISSPLSFTPSPAKPNSSQPKQNLSLKDKSSSESHAKQRDGQFKSHAPSSKSSAIRKQIKIQNLESPPSTDIKVHHQTSQIESVKDNTDHTPGFGSGNSAFCPISAMNDNSEHLEVLLPENIFQLASQILVWLNANKHESVNNLELIPQDMRKSSTVLIDWWVDIVVKLDSKHLFTTIQYLMSTFSQQFVQFLITNRDQQGNTCLHYVIGHQYWESFSVLYSTGFVDPNVFNIQGYTVMMLASTLQVSDDILGTHIRRLTYNANLNLQSKEQGHTAIFLAALHNNDNTITLLSSLGADINIPDNDGNTPLLIAVTKNNINAVNAIMSSSRVLTESQNKEGNTALKIAESNNFSEILSLLQGRNSSHHSTMPKHSTMVGVTGVTRSTKLYKKN